MIIDENVICSVYEAKWRVRWKQVVIFYYKDDDLVDNDKMNAFIEFFVE